MTTGALADDLMQVYQQALANDPLVNQAKAQRDAATAWRSIVKGALNPFPWAYRDKRIGARAYL